MFKLINLDMPKNVQEMLSDSEFKARAKDATEDAPAELLIMEEIGEGYDGFGVSASSVVDFLGKNKGKPVDVRINSPGGLVYDGLTIYNGLAQHDGQVSVTIEGLAFSAASFIAMAGDLVRIHEAADFGIHRAGGLAIGNSKSMRAVAEWLDVIDEHLVEIYAAKTGKESAKIQEWLDGTDDGTLFSGKEAFKHGFADELIPLKKKTAKNRVAAEYTAKLLESHATD